jgi:hypothetical protein
VPNAHALRSLPDTPRTNVLPTMVSHAPRAELGDQGGHELGRVEDRGGEPYHAAEDEPFVDGEVRVEHVVLGNESRAELHDVAQGTATGQHGAGVVAGGGKGCRKGDILQGLGDGGGERARTGSEAVCRCGGGGSG